MRIKNSLIFPLLIVFVLLTPKTWAATTWQCKAYDAENKQWLEQSTYQRTAINKAFDACKKQSRIPASCTVSKEACEMMLDGMVSLRPTWRCMALDAAAISWFSNTYDHAMDAVFAAQAYCKAYSALPDTCYIEPYSCRDLSIRSL